MAKHCLKMHPDYPIQQEADKLIMILNTDEVSSAVAPAKAQPVRNQFAIDLSKLPDEIG